MNGILSRSLRFIRFKGKYSVLNTSLDNPFTTPSYNSNCDLISKRIILNTCFFNLKFLFL